MLFEIWISTSHFAYDQTLKKNPPMSDAIIRHDRPKYEEEVGENK